MTSTSPDKTGTVTRAVARRIGAAVFWLAVWQAAAVAVHRDFLLASPMQVARTLVTLLPTGDFWTTIGWSLGRIALGFTGAAVLGALLAISSAAWPVARALWEPAIAAIRSAPVVSFIILLLLWTDSSHLPVFTSLLMVLPVMYANVLQGIAQRDPQMLEAAKVFRVPFRRRLVAIDIPAVLPFLAAATRVGVGLAWKSGVAAEVIGVATGSIGERLYEAKVFLSSADLFAWTIVIVVLSVACERLLLRALRSVPGAPVRSS
jgi:NitT/TauT family transport system permease protein